MDLFERYPDTLVIALTRVGSLIALLKVASLLKVYHQRKFEKSHLEQSDESLFKDLEASRSSTKKINDSHYSINSEELLLLDTPQKDQQFRDMFSFENIKQLMAKVHELDVKALE